MEKFSELMEALNAMIAYIRVPETFITREWNEQKLLLAVVFVLRVGFAIPGSRTILEEI